MAEDSKEEEPMLAELTREERRAGGYGRTPGVRHSRQARVEAAFSRLRAMMEAAKLSQRQRDVALLYAEGRTDREIAKALGLPVEAVWDTMRCATKHLDREFPDPSSLLPWVSRSDLLRVMQAFPDPEPEFEDYGKGEGEATSLHAKPWGERPGDLQEPQRGGPGHVALCWQRLLFRLRGLSLDQRGLARVAEVPVDEKPAMEEAEKKRREEERAARKKKSQARS